MADDFLYAAAADSNKRKYEDSPSPVARRATGFSSTPDAAAPPQLSEIELATQKAQEIAARFLNNADPTKRARVENVGNGGRGFDSSDYSSQKPSGYGLSGPPQGSSSCYPGPSKRIDIPNGRVGVIIGKGGETIKYLQQQSGAKIQVTRDMDADPNSPTRGVDLMGTPDQIARAEQLIQDVLSEAEAGGAGSTSRRVGGQSFGAEQFVMKIPNNKVGLVIGKGGETIKSMQTRTGARIQVIPLHLPPGDTSQERTVQIDGTSEQIEAAKLIVDEVISENRNRNSSMSGGYSQQGYQARPPSNWGLPGAPMQQPGYSYPQAGAYPGQPPQYSMNQPPYSGYPQQSTSSGYPTSWDPSTASQTQQAPQGAGYEYYNQQQPPQQQPAQGDPAAPTDASGYGYGAYGQAQAYSQGQGYGQYGYGSYPTGAAAAAAGYGQPQQNPAAGYENQQQGYNSKSSNTSNPTPDASYGAQDEANQAPASGQSCNAGGQPAANPNYPPQASNQPGYGGGYGSQTTPPSYAPPQAQKPPGGQAAYAQPEQSPSSQGAGYAQSGYSQSQPAAAHAGYAQTAAYPISQAGYGAPPYAAAAAATQPGYGQQQAAAYNSAYGGAAGYSQPPAYPSADGSAGGDARGAYDSTTPPPQSAPPTGSAKASPPA
ncbi:far upstream element-binding protein 2-like [Salvia splendens]|uniref:far upstream element-binding protein 2-like n=1 Tax=Salvia splendens TaxID=180675 RepID=UPI00110478F2|nr:far upstream element-binding protein 2-like [Salvia splendens]